MITGMNLMETPILSEEAPGNKPVLAILTIDDEIQTFRGNRHNFADLIKTGDKLGFLSYVVTVNNLKLNRRRVLGYTYQQRNDSWVKSYFPRPHIVYNRIPMHEDERLPEVQSKLKALARRSDIRLFNRRFFNKWSLFKWLKQSRATRAFIPETRKLTTQHDLTSLLKRHSLLYLKPIRGKAGVGIMSVQVQQEKNLPYTLHIQEEKGSQTYRCSTLPRLWKRVVKQSQAIGGPYIAQQGITLASHNDRPFDLRALIQKNGSGKWELTGIGARVAGSKSITTHVPRGGYIEDPEKVLISVFGQEKAKRVLTRVKSATLVLARQIEQSSQTRLGEMSMDLGVDASGEIWFFEANSKPMKFDEPHIRQKSLEQIYNYSQYLYQTSFLSKGGSAQ